MNWIICFMLLLLLVQFAILLLVFLFEHSLQPKDYFASTSHWLRLLPRSEKNKAIVIWNVRDLRMSRWFCSCHRGRPAKTSRGWRWRRRWGVLNRRHGLLAEAPYIFRFVSFYFSISDFSAGEWASGVVVHNSFELNRVSFCSGIEAQS